MRKVWIWALAGGGVVVLFVMAFLVPGLGSGSASGTTTVPLPSKMTATAAYEARLSAFEQADGITTSSWYAHVKGRDLQNSGASLWVYTDLKNDAAAKTVAAQVCEAYAKYVLIDRQVVTTVVHAADTRTLARCGPGA